MPRRPTETRRRILESAYRLFYREGFQRTGVEDVAEAAGITKRTLYNHYPSKDGLIAGVLEAQADLAAAEIHRWCGNDPASPEELVHHIFAGLRRWARMPDWRGSGFTRAAMELAWAPGHPARQAAAAQKRAIEQVLTEVLAGAGAAAPARNARELALLIEGANALRLVHGDEAWFDMPRRPLWRWFIALKNQSVVVTRPTARPLNHAPRPLHYEPPRPLRRHAPAVQPPDDDAVQPAVDSGAGDPGTASP